MRDRNLLLLGAILLIAFVFVLAMVFPFVVPPYFLAATTVVCTFSMVLGYRTGIGAYILVCMVLFALPDVHTLPWSDIVTRYSGFTLTTIFLSVLSIKLQRYERDYYKKAAQLAAIAESSDDAIIGKDLKGIITSWNKGAEQIFGYKEKEIVGKSILTLFPDDRKEEENLIMSRIMKGYKVSHFETVRKKKNGEIFPVSLTVSPIKDNYGKIIGASKVTRDISLRVEYEKNLKESDERYKSFIQNSSEGIWRAELREPISTSLPVEEQIDLIFKHAYFAECNKAMAEMYGYNNPDDIVGRPMTFLLPDTDKTRDYLRAFIENGYNLEDAESEEIGADGKVLYFSNSLVAIVETESIYRAWGVQRDITERKRQAEELERSRERYKTFIDNSEEAIWLVEYNPPVDTQAPIEKQIEDFFDNGYVVDANETMLKLYGFPRPESIIGKPSAIISPRSTHGEEFLRLFINNHYAITDFETSAVVDGQLRFGSNSFKGIVQDGKVVRGWVVQRETTKQKLQEIEIQNSQERYRTFIENADEAIWRIEFKTPIDTSLAHSVQVEKFFAEGYIAEANDATPKILGVEKLDDILDKRLNELGLRTEADVVFMKQFVQDGYSVKDYESSETRNGKTTYHSSSIKGIVENGKWVRAWVVRRDITPQKEYLIERERLLIQAEEAKRALEIASAEKDRFLANLSHELRTPLVSILGYSAMLLETNPDSENAKKMITTINKNAQLQVNLIEDLLDLSRIISGKIELKKAFFNTTELAKYSVDTFRKQASDKGLKIVENYEDCNFYGDKKRLSQVFLNLLSNAIKFTEKGEISICVKCSEEYLTIKVMDSGVGIDPKNFDLLFQPFKQLDSSSTRAKQGLGLGLSIVKNIVGLHGGKVSVESKIGEGSIFKVYLPVVHASVVADEQAVHVTPSVTFEGVKMLVVEDDSDSANFVKYLYEQKGANVVWASSAKKGREAIEKQKFDLYIFDLSMPEEDGISLIKSVRDKGDKTKAVALTAFADTYYEQKAIEAGFDMFLKKPSSLSDLLSVIKLIR